MAQARTPGRPSGTPGRLGGGLMVEVDEDVQLVDNAAAASLLSPSVWVQRPSLAAPPALQQADCPDRPASEHHWPPRSQGDTHMEQPTSRFADPSCDPELAYLQLKDDTAERERQQQDAEHLAALQEAAARGAEANAVLEAALNGRAAGLQDVLEENANIKGLLAALQVRKEDFIINPNLPPAEQAAMMQAAGLRLIAAMCQQQHQPGAGGVQQQQQHQQQQAAATDGEQRQQQQQRGDGEAAAGASLPDAAGLVTPCGVKAGGASSRIAAHRGGASEDACMEEEAEDPATRQRSEQVERLLLSARQEPGSRQPPTPQDFPAEAQIAAAALTMTEGDPTEALIAMLEKAMAGRRQHHHGLVQAPHHL